MSPLRSKSNQSTASLELSTISPALTAEEPELASSGLGARAEELPPTDRGKAAYEFLIAAFVLEVFVWGYSYSFATILVYLQVSGQLEGHFRGRR